MNIVITLLIMIGVLFLVKPAQAANDMFINSLIPVVIKNSWKVPFIGEVFASGTNEIETIDGTPVEGMITLREIPENLDTEITVKVSGLKPDEQYIAIYYRNESRIKVSGIPNKTFSQRPLPHKQSTKTSKQYYPLSLLIIS